MPLPSTERILLGPGPSLIAPRVMRALAAPVLSHLDPEFVPMLDDVRASLQRVFRADSRSLTIATSGTGTSAMEAAVANTVADGMRAIVIVTGYFGDRLAQIIERYGARVRRIHVQWGRSVDPQRLEDELVRDGADIVGIVHAETSTGVRNPVKELAALARAHGALTIVDTVTSLGGHDVDLAGWGVDVAYSCTQKCIGAPSGLAPLAVSGAARERLVKCRSFYLDLRLLEDYWVGRKYHHTMSTSLVYALREALLMIDEEGLAERVARHERNHRALAAGIEAMGLALLPPEGERLWTLNAVCVPAGVDEAAVRRTLLTTYNIEVGAGLGPLAGKIWRVGLMGASSTPQTLLQFLASLEGALAANGHEVPAGAGVAAAGAAFRPALV
ncbi:MAG TPA: alanine--glyoxylate aminotransferase family protein [Vicinamibacterales bacterium]|jgi:alanine-glyoxylate transaminase / serine-glyoxylate transaminase / serine-pyruvate transaminase|nr:alanine--glyoxylate aminotransferase family protein [Vicinamibacterales bacterium]